MTVLVFSSLLTLMGVIGTLLSGRHSRRVRRWGWRAATSTASEALPGVSLGIPCM